MEAVLFYIFATLAVIGGILMVAIRNPLGGAFCLVISLVSLAALFAMQNAEFIFILQILVYAGAIMVLVIFTIMLLNLSPEELRESPVHPIRTFVTAVLCGLGAAMMIMVLRQIPIETAPLESGFGNIEPVGRLLFSSMLYPFEIISLVLLVAVVGVVLLAKREI